MAKQYFKVPEIYFLKLDLLSRSITFRYVKRIIAPPFVPQ